MITYFMSNVHSVCSLVCKHVATTRIKEIEAQSTDNMQSHTRLSIVTDVGYEVIDRVGMGVLNFRVTGEKLGHVNVPEGGQRSI